LIFLHVCLLHKEDFCTKLLQGYIDKFPLILFKTNPSILTNHTALLHQSLDYSCYVSRPILTPLPLWLQKHTDQHAQNFAHSPGLWHLPMNAKVLVPEAGDFVELILLYQCAVIRKNHCLKFRKHRAVPTSNCVLRRSQTLVNCMFL